MKKQTQKDPIVESVQKIGFIIGSIILLAVAVALFVNIIEELKLLK